MKMLTGFDYLAPRSLEEFFSLKREYGGEARVLAGGTDLLLAMKEKELKPRYVIDIKKIQGLDGTSPTSQGYKIGALSTIHSIETSQIASENFPLLCEAASQLGSYQIRHRATLGGNICNASPAADMVPPLLVIDARLNVVSESEERTIPIEQFFEGPGKTVLGPTEILKSVSVSNPPTAGCSFIKLGRRRAMDCSIVNAAAVLVLESDDLCKNAKIAIGSVAPTPLRAIEAENVLKGRRITDDLITKSALAAQEVARPISDVRASAEYRHKIVRVLVARALTNAYHMARERVLRERTH